MQELGGDGPILGRARVRNVFAVLQCIHDFRLAKLEVIHAILTIQCAWMAIWE